MALTLPILDVLPVTPRARVVTLDLNGHTFPYCAGQAVLLSAPGRDDRRAYSLAEAPEVARALGRLELLIGTDAEGRTWIPFEPGSRVVVDGPIGKLMVPS